MFFVGILFICRDYIEKIFFYEVSLVEYVGVNIPVGEKYEITYQTDPGGISNDLVWRSSDESVASVSGKGVITAKKEGTAIITVSICGIKKDECIVTVYKGKDTLTFAEWAANKYTSQKNETVEAETEPQSGAILSGAEDFNGSEITIKASTVNSCVVKLKTTSGIDRLSFYVRAGDTVTVGVPAECLYVYFASGDTWYGKNLLFGEDTYYSMDDELADFTQYTWEYTLTPITNGNFSETPIDASEF